jgi:hypothetical protein
MRTFEDKPATRERVPLLISLMGPSGGGKTFSALRLATGIQRVSGGEIFVIDTEARRALHYADRFTFRHLEFGAPFGSLDYLAAIEHCAKKGAGVVIIDSLSHEHEGPGGLLEQHQAEVERLSRGDAGKAERVKMLAWSAPKAARRRLLNSMTQLPINVIACFRAKEKLKIERGKEPVPMGFMPIGGDEFVFEMTVSALLLPGAGGVPTWNSGEIGEKMMTKLPGQFRALLTGQSGPLDEAAGEAMARWAAGDSDSAASELSAAVSAAATLAELDAVRTRATAAKDRLNRHEAAALRDLISARKAFLESETKRGSSPKNDAPAPRMREPGEDDD